MTDPNPLADAVRHAIRRRDGEDVPERRDLEAAVEAKKESREQAANKVARGLMKQLSAATSLNLEPDTQITLRFCTEDEARIAFGLLTLARNLKP